MYFLSDMKKLTPVETKVFENMDVVFTCGSEQGVPVWYFNQGNLLDNVMSEGYNLIINNVMTINKGKYQCRGITSDYYNFIAEAELDVISKLA